MYSALLQDWITLRVSSGSTSITQSEADWASFQQHRDIVFWLDVRSLALAGGTDVLVSFETALTLDLDPGFDTPMAQERFASPVR